jgi:cytoskeleton protein RodZ
MPDLGSKLAQARERQALSLAELSRRTKISERTLRAIERNDMQELPGGIYTRGMLRAYAREVGCDPEEIVNRFRTEFDDQAAEANDALDRGEAQCDPGRVHSSDIDAIDRRRSRLEAIASVSVVLLAGMLYASAGWLGHREPALPDKMPAANAALSPRSATEEEPAHLEAGTAGSPDGARPVDKDIGTRPIDKETSELRLDIHPHESCWLTATADGQRVVYRLLNAGDQTRIEAHDEVVLRIGNAAAIDYAINGVAARPLGAAGEPVTVHLTPHNYQQFLNQ